MDGKDVLYDQFYLNSFIGIKKSKNKNAYLTTLIVFRMCQ